MVVVPDRFYPALDHAIRNRRDIKCDVCGEPKPTHAEGPEAP
jgi:hypothetical protein